MNKPTAEEIMKAIDELMFTGMTPEERQKYIDDRIAREQQPNLVKVWSYVNYLKSKSDK